MSIVFFLMARLRGERFISANRQEWLSDDELRRNKTCITHAFATSIEAVYRGLLGLDKRNKKI